MVQSNRVPTRPGEDTKVEGTKDEEHGNRDPERHVTETDCLGYLPTCECGLWAGKPLRPLVEVLKDIEPVRQGCLILDPFGGIGTTAQTAEHLGHRSISIELNPEYHEIACKRVLEPPRWWLRETGEVLDDEPSDAPLFAGAP